MKAYLMPSIKKELDLIVAEFSKINNYRIDSILLFGSYACGIPHDHSNYDLCIVTDAETASNSNDYKSMRYDAIWEPINKIIYTVRNTGHEPSGYNNDVKYIRGSGDNSIAAQSLNEYEENMPFTGYPYINCYFTTREKLLTSKGDKASIEYHILKDGVTIFKR